MARFPQRGSDVTRPTSTDRKLSRELVMRVSSALVMMPIGLYCAWRGGIPLMIIAALAAGAMAFEWTRMTKIRVPFLVMSGAVLANVLYLVDPRWALITLCGVGAISMAAEERGGRRSSALLGTLYAGGLPMAMQALRAIPEAGFAIAMGVMILSWSSDSAAYFSGRHFKGPLLAPKDSPNKTWSGAIGAVIGSLLVGGAFGALINGPILVWGFMGVVVSVSAQMGDLFESQIKRRYGVKDTSGFLPGHGGVMDRLDGFGTACVVMVGVLKLFPTLPALLVG